MASITLEFHIGVGVNSKPVLSRVIFTSHDGSEPRVSVRGKTGGPLHHHGTFQWTKAVKGLSVLLLRAATRARNGDNLGEALLSGRGGTLASSLTYAIDKEPCWLSEMFGSNPVGLPYCKRLFLRNNPSLRMGAPVALGLNNHIVSNDNVHVRLNGEPVEDASILVEIIDAIEDEKPKKASVSLQKSETSLSKVA